MEKLRKIIGLPDTTEMRFPDEKVLNYKKINIRGCSSSLVLLEYSYADEGPTGWFPWKRQFIFKEDGALLKILHDYKYRLVKIFPNEKPFLVTISSTGRGNGIHNIYKYRNDSLLNMFDYSHFFFPKTYDEISCESFANVPAELKMTIRDYNKDGFNDLIFTGSIIYDTIQGCVTEREYQGKKKVKLIFRYDKQYDAFTPMERFMSLEAFLSKK